MPIQKTLSVALQIRESGVNSRRVVSNALAGVNPVANINIDEGTINSGDTITFNTITALFLVKCDGPLQIVITNQDQTTAFSIDTLFCLTGALDQVTISNSSTNLVNIGVFYA